MKNLHQASRQEQHRSLKFSVLLGVVLFSVTTVCAQPESLHDFWKENSNWNLHAEERLNNLSDQYQQFPQSPDSLTSIEKTDRPIIGEQYLPNMHIPENCAFCSHRRETFASFSNMPGFAELSYIFRTDLPWLYSTAAPHYLFKGKGLEQADSAVDMSFYSDGRFEVDACDRGEQPRSHYSGTKARSIKGAKYFGNQLKMPN